MSDGSTVGVVYHEETADDDESDDESGQLLSDINMSAAANSDNERTAVNAPSSSDLRPAYGTDGPWETGAAVTRATSDIEKQTTPTFVYMLTLLSAIGGFLFGYDTGVIAGALILVRVTFSLSPVWQEVIVSVTMGSAAIFSLVSGWTNDRFGRKPTIVVASVVFTCGALLLAAAQERYMLVIGRFILGIGIGLASSTVPMYIAECAPSHLRGRLVTINNTFITGGQFIASVIAGAFSTNHETGWRFMFGLAAVPSIIQLIGFLFMPDTPRWLVTRGQHAKARAILYRIHGDGFNIEQEIDEIKSSMRASTVEDGQCVLFKMLSIAHVRRALVVGCLLQMFQQMTGINTVMYYSATIIKMSGVEDTSQAIWLAALTASVNFLFTFVGLFLVDRIGRRPLTLGSLTGTMCSLIVLAVGFQLAALNSPNVTVIETTNGTATASICRNYTSCNGCMMNAACGYCYVGSAVSNITDGSCLPVLHDTDGDVVFDQAAYGRCSSTSKTRPAPHWAYGYCPTNYAWMATFGLVLYLIFFAPGMGPMPWTINSEIYPLWARSTGNSVTTCVNWVSNLIISMTFLSLTEAITRYGAFWLYSGFAALGILFVALCLPETKGKHLEEVEELFSQSLVSCRRVGRRSLSPYERVND